MHLRCKQEMLMNGINIALKACSTRTTMPILECILIKAYNNQVTLVGYNLELGIESTIEAEIIEGGSIVLESKIFAEIVRKMPDQIVELCTDDRHLTKIICEDSEFLIAGQAGEQFPDLPEVERHKSYTLSHHTFKEMIRQTIFSVAQEESRPILTGELLQMRDGFLRIVSFDGNRISYRQTEVVTGGEIQEVVIPGRTLNEISKILSSEESDMMTLYFEDKNVLFDLGECKVVSRLLEGQFLKYEQVFSSDYTTRIKVDRKKLLMRIERAALISREGKNPIKIEIDGDLVVITSRAKLGSARETLGIELEGNQLVIGFNPKFLIEALKAIEESEIYIQFISPLTPCVLRPVEGEHYRYLISPVRLGVNA
ncbi:MAG: DNA polymerase III subunit beta [Cellulosilyticaceae bacterium]